MSFTSTARASAPLEVDADAVIEFPAGLIGLGGARYALVATDRGRAVRLAALRRGPRRRAAGHEPVAPLRRLQVELSDADAERIGAGDPSQVDVWVTVRAAGELSDFSCNLRAPIVVWKGRGHQVINEAPDAPVRAPLFPEAAAVQAA